tara:strand:+ start:8405 stop:9118 length:714 start_codon:yes stop_codon:yes gene_type:complete
VGNPPPVVDLYGKESRAAPVRSGSHQVQRGETLYSIAWRYGWDYRALARANHIPAPYTIYPGQTIVFAGGPSKPATPTTPAPAASPSRPSASGATSTPVQAPAPPKPSSPAQAGPVNWQWPANGKLVERFSSSSGGRRGVAIAGHHGEPVLAAAAGRVVYKGSGLTGYGNLLIIKHNERWLSAYAHNDEMLVKEGQSVKAGERIATMGASGTFRTQLHFEIRKDGQPIDPLTVLPSR